MAGVKPFEGNLRKKKKRFLEEEADWSWPRRGATQGDPWGSKRRPGMDRALQVFGAELFSLHTMLHS